MSTRRLYLSVQELAELFPALVSTNNMNFRHKVKVKLAPKLERMDENLFSTVHFHPKLEVNTVASYWGHKNDLRTI